MAAFSWSLVPAQRLNYSTTPGTPSIDPRSISSMHGRGLNGAWLYPIRTDNHGHPFSCYHLAVAVEHVKSNSFRLFRVKFLLSFLNSDIDIRSTTVCFILLECFKCIIVIFVRVKVIETLMAYILSIYIFSNFF